MRPTGGSTVAEPAASARKCWWECQRVSGSDPIEVFKTARSIESSVGGGLSVEPSNAVRSAGWVALLSCSRLRAADDGRVRVAEDGLAVARPVPQPCPVGRACRPARLADEYVQGIRLGEPLEDHQPAHVRQAERVSRGSTGRRCRAAAAPTHPGGRASGGGCARSPSPRPSAGRASRKPSTLKVRNTNGRRLSK